MTHDLGRLRRNGAVVAMADGQEGLRVVLTLPMPSWTFNPTFAQRSTQLIGQLGELQEAVGPLGVVIDVRRPIVAAWAATAVIPVTTLESGSRALDARGCGVTPDERFQATL